MKNIECPHCHTFNTSPASPKYTVRLLGLTSLLLGFALAIFLIGIPFIFLGLLMLIGSFFFPENGRMRCRSCKFVWTR